MNNNKAYFVNKQSISNENFRLLLLQHDVREIADKSGMKPCTVYSYRGEHTVVPAYFIPLAFHATQDHRWLDEICRPVDHIARPINIPISADVKHVLEEQEIKAMIDMGDAYRVIAQAYADDRITKHEMQKIRSALNREIRDILTIEDCIEREVSA